MDTNLLKKYIGLNCQAISPRSRKREYEPATIVGVSVNMRRAFASDEIVERVEFKVKQHRTTYGRDLKAYRFSFEVSDDRIILPNIKGESE